MKKCNLFKYKLAYIVYALLLVSTIITIFIVYKNIDNSWSIKFVIGYVIFLLLSSGCFTIVTIVNMRTLKWFDLRKRLLKFIGSFVLFGALNYISNYVFKQSKIDSLSWVGSALGMSVGLSFYDLIFFRNKEN